MLRAHAQTYIRRFRSRRPHTLDGKGDEARMATRPSACVLAALTSPLRDYPASFVRSASSTGIKATGWDAGRSRTKACSPPRPSRIR